LRKSGAMFTADLLEFTGVLQPQLEQSLGLLVARGLVTADAFSPLRWLARPEHEKRKHLRSLPHRPGRDHNRLAGRLAAGQSMLGRWSLCSQSPGAAGSVTAQAAAGTDLASVCHALLRRYGVVFRAVLERESLVPPWRDLLRYLRRMEDRGEVLGGRFVDGFSGEQFALPEAVGLLRNLEQQATSEKFLVIAASDPLNLGGIITPGVKTPAINGHRILLQHGLPVARLQGDKLEVLDPKLQSKAESLRLQMSPLRHLHRQEA
jgi:ATP-dependent Lhr-like helicase